MVRNIPLLQTEPVLVISISRVRLVLILSSRDFPTEHWTAVSSKYWASQASLSPRYFQLVESAPSPSSPPSTLTGLTLHPSSGLDTKSWPNTLKVEQSWELRSHREFCPAITGKGVGLTSSVKSEIFSRYEQNVRLRSDVTDRLHGCSRRRSSRGS